RLVGLGRVSDAVLNIINRVRAPIDRALDRVVTWIVDMARRAGRFILGRIRGRDERTPEEKMRDLQKAARELRPRIEALVRRGTLRPLLLARLAVWRVQYKLTSLTVEAGDIRATINPTVNMYHLDEIALGGVLEPILQRAEARFLREEQARPGAAGR